MVPCFLMSASADLGPIPRMLPVWWGVCGQSGWEEEISYRLGGRGHCVFVSVCVRWIDRSGRNGERRKKEKEDMRRKKATYRSSRSRRGCRGR